MILMALEGSSKTVFIDFLSYQDIQLLREKRSGSKSANKSNNYTSNPQQNLKRYVILTYTTEFEKVHYPLVLTLISQPDQECLKRVFKRVVDAYREIKSFDGEARSSGFSTRTNEFFKTGMANYNPTFEENKQLNRKLSMLLEFK